MLVLVMCTVAKAHQSTLRHLHQHRNTLSCCATAPPALIGLSVKHFLCCLSPFAPITVLPYQDFRHEMRALRFASLGCSDERNGGTSALTAWKTREPSSAMNWSAVVTSIQGGGRSLVPACAATAASTASCSWGSAALLSSSAPAKRR